jgi:hypothetical protein
MSDERLDRYLAGELTEEERRLFEEEMLRSSQLSADAYDELAVQDAVAEAVRLRAARQSGQGAGSSGRRGQTPSARARRARWRIPRWAIPSAAAAVLLVAATAVLRMGDSDGPLTFRGGDAGLRALEPVGEQSGPLQRFVWSREPASLRYRFELFDADSRMVLSRIVADTFITTADLGNVPTYGFWQITPLDDMNMAGPGSGPVWYHVRE